jgi:hypothetical protein
MHITRLVLHFFCDRLFYVNISLGVYFASALDVLIKHANLLELKYAIPHNPFLTC